MAATAEGEPKTGLGKPLGQVLGDQRPGETGGAPEDDVVTAGTISGSAHGALLGLRGASLTEPAPIVIDQNRPSSDPAYPVSST